MSAIRKTKSLEFRALDMRCNTVSVSPALDFVRTFVLSDFAHASAIRFSKRFDILPLGQQQEGRVSTMYKRKVQKVRPVDSSVSDGTAPSGGMQWKESVTKSEMSQSVATARGPYDTWLIPKFSMIAKGTRLTNERVAAMLVGSELLPGEKNLMMQVLYNREAALSWDFSEIGKVRDSVAEPQQIRTIPHTAWQAPGFPIPRALNETVVEMLKERIANGLLEPCHGPYRNPWFLVKKKSGKYRMVNAAMNINKVTIRDANLPPSVDEFSEEFAGMHITSLIDFFSGYDQVELDKRCRDLTAFMTPLGLLRQTTLPQGATNSVAQFVRIVVKILADLIPNVCQPFLDDIGVKGPYSRYKDREVVPGIRQFVLEHIWNLDRVLADVERSGATISGEKSQFCMAGIKIVGFVCDARGRSPESAKVAKVVEWGPCTDLAAARAFIGLCVYYRIWVKDFATVAAPIYRLFRREVPFVWGEEQVAAMETLKAALTTAPALRSIDYADNAGEIILAVDASLRGWGAVLQQVDSVTKKRHPIRYESGLWNEQESRYDAGKRECRGLLKALKKVRFWLYGVRFAIEIDANTLVAQLNQSATDLPGALVTRWLAWIRLFDFDVRHVPGTKHGAADGLSRRPRGPSDDQDDLDELDIDDFIDAELNPIRVYPVTVGEDPDVNVLDDSYSEQSQRIARYLATMVRPSEMSRKEFRQFKLQALKFLVKDRYLFRRANKNVPLRRVVDGLGDRLEILKELHDESGHRGREGTYRRVADRYWWDTLWDDSCTYVRTCDSCQRRAPRREEEALHPTWVAGMWQKVAVDVVHMPQKDNMNYLVVARDDFSGWPEARALHAATTAAVARFVYEDIICRHGCFQRLVLDGGPENKNLVEELARRYRIKRVVTSPYHPQANGMVERGHQPIVDGLAKMTEGGFSNWVRNLHAVLWADRTTVRMSTGASPYRLNHGSDAVLPVELANPTWQILDWDRVQSTSDLLALRARQLQRRDEDLEETALFLRRMRESRKELFDDDNRIRACPFACGDMVLLHDTKLEKSYSHKLTFRWLGPFRIAEAFVDKGTYILEELDGARMRGTVAGCRLKRFYSRTDLESSQGSEMVSERNRSEDDNEEEMGLRLRPRHQAEVQISESERVRPVQPGLAVVVPALQSHQPLDFIHTS